MFGVHQGGKLLIQTRTKTKQSSSRLDKELSPMVDIKHDRVYISVQVNFTEFSLENRARKIR